MACARLGLITKPGLFVLLGLARTGCTGLGQAALLGAELIGPAWGLVTV